MSALTVGGRVAVWVALILAALSAVPVGCLPSTPILLTRPAAKLRGFFPSAPKPTNFGSSIRLFAAFDVEKEEHRAQQRTVFTFDEWQQHRSSDRYLRELARAHRSMTFRSLAGQALAVSASAALVVGYNALAETRLGLPLLTLPPLAFSLSVSSLSLLLAFRINSAYARWKEARTHWAVISAKSFEVMRQALAWVQDKKELAVIFRHTVAFSRALKWHLGDRSSEKRLVEDLSGALTHEEIAYVRRSRNKPQFVLSKLTQVIAAQKLVPNVQNHIDRALTDMNVAMESCDCLLTTPIPLGFAHLADRALMVWLLALPLGLYREFRAAAKWAVPAVVFVQALFLLWIEDLGTQIEEPFSVLPLDKICYNILSTGESLFEEHDIEWFQDYINNDSRDRAPLGI